MIPWDLETAVRWETGGDYWYGVLVHNTAFLSCHILGHCEDSDDTMGRATILFHQTTVFVQRCMEVCQSDKLELVIGVDADATLPGNYGDHTGSNTLPPLPTHSYAKQMRVLSWMEALNLQAQNTVKSPTDQPIGETLWTCGTNRLTRKISNLLRRHDTWCARVHTSVGESAVSPQVRP